MDETREIPTQSPTIRCPNDEALLEKLRNKRTEYVDRLKEGHEYTHPGQRITLGLLAGNVGPLDSYRKHKLLDKVLDEGEVFTWDFTLEAFEDPVLKEFDESYRPLVADRLQNACAVIDAYCKNDMSEISGGTGLN